MNEQKDKAPLNGWKRLWIVYSVFVALILSINSYQEWPPLTLGFKEIVYETRGAYYDFSEMYEQDKVKEKIEAFLNEKLAESEVPKLAYLTTKSGKKIEGSDAVAMLRYTTDRMHEKVAEQRKSLVIRQILLFLTLSTGVYLLGWSFAWIKRGF